MTEAEWLTTYDPEPLQEFVKGKISDRKLRLFAVACCRSIWDVVDDPRSRHAVDQVENYMDGKIAFDVMKTAHEEAGMAAAEGREHYHTRNEYPSSAAAFASDMLTHGFWDLDHAAGVCAADAQWACAIEGGIGGESHADPHGAARAIQSNFVRDLVGNPFRPVAFSPSWLTSTVVGLAEGIYADRAFDRLPILADALQDAGCEDADVLSHCRGGGPHVRGCWVVDGVLGKQ